MNGAAQNNPAAPAKQNDTEAKVNKTLLLQQRIEENR